MYSDAFKEGVHTFFVELLLLTFGLKYECSFYRYQCKVLLTYVKIGEVAVKGKGSDVE
jgi:hypothetical protein